MHEHITLRWTVLVSTSMSVFVSLLFCIYEVLRRFIWIHERLFSEADADLLCFLRVWVR